jgi:hypothetical protein
MQSPVRAPKEFANCTVLRLPSAPRTMTLPPRRNALMGEVPPAIDASGPSSASFRPG